MQAGTAVVKVLEHKEGLEKGFLSPSRCSRTASLSYLRTMLPESSSRPLPSRRPNQTLSPHFTQNPCKSEEVIRTHAYRSHSKLCIGAARYLL